MDFDGSYGSSVLLFFGETENSAGNDNKRSNMRLDMLNLRITDADY